MSETPEERTVSAEKVAMLNDLETEYRTLLPDAERFTDELSRQITHLLEQQKIYLAVPVQSRVKSWVSIAEKIERKSYTIKSVKELPDLVGLRVILLFQRDVSTVCKLLPQTFSVSSQEDTQARLGETQFGYGSMHLNLAFPETWKGIPTFLALADFTAEVQVRTTAQHLWAAASHLLQYKHEADIPPPVRRAIHRTSALLETVDLEFERVLQQRGDYQQNLDTDTDELLNVDSLAKVLDELLPAEYKSEFENYASVISDLKTFKIDTPKSLRSLLMKHKTVTAKIEAQIEAISRQASLSGHEFSNIQIRKALFSHGSLVSSAMSEEFGEAFFQHTLSKWQDMVQLKDERNPELASVASES